MIPFSQLIAKILLHLTFCLVLLIMAKCMLSKRTMTFYMRSASWIKQAITTALPSAMLLHMTKSSYFSTTARASSRITPKNSLRRTAKKQKPNITTTRAMYSRATSSICTVSRGTRITARSSLTLIFTLTA